MTSVNLRTEPTPPRSVPSPRARQLDKQCTNVIGLRPPEISGAFFPPMLRGIESGVREAGYDLLIGSTQGGHARRPLSEHNTDGLIIFPNCIDHAELQRLYERDFPVVLLYQTPPDDTPFPMITVENRSGAEKLISHLIGVHRRRRIVFLRGPANNEDSRWREQGYRDALESHRIELDARLVAGGEFVEQKAYATIAKMLADGVEFDAVFAGDDDAVIGVYRALKLAGRTIPDDVAVVGFDDVEFARYLSPALTTVHSPIEEIGREAVHQLLRLIQGKPAEALTLLPTELVLRESCGCVPAIRETTGEFFFE